MSSINKYTDGPSMESVKIIKDFLPAPEDLVFKEKSVKITLSLTEDSVLFFKKQAKKNHTKYQLMIRNLVSEYAKKFNK